MTRTARELKVIDSRRATCHECGCDGIQADDQDGSLISGDIEVTIDAEDGTLLCAGRSDGSDLAHLLRRLRGGALVSRDDMAGAPTQLARILPKLESARGVTVYRCARGHEHDFMSLALACDLFQTSPEHEATCSTCGGSGGGPDEALACVACNGTGDAS